MANCGISWTPTGPFQNTVRLRLSSWLKSSTVFGPISAIFFVGGMASTATTFALDSPFNSSATTTSTGSRRRTPLFSASLISPAAVADGLVFDERRADFTGLRFQESGRHAAADEQAVHFFHDIFQHGHLIADLGAAEKRGKGVGGVFQKAAQGIDFLFQQKSGDRRQVFGDAGNRGMGAVGGAEGIIDINIAQAGQRFGEVGVAGFFFGMEPEIFQQQDIAGF